MPKLSLLKNIYIYIWLTFLCCSCAHGGQGGRGRAGGDANVDIPISVHLDNSKVALEPPETPRIEVPPPEEHSSDLFSNSEKSIKIQNIESDGQLEDAPLEDGEPVSIDPPGKETKDEKMQTPLHRP